MAQGGLQYWTSCKATQIPPIHLIPMGQGGSQPWTLVEFPAGVAKVVLMVETIPQTAAANIVHLPYILISIKRKFPMVNSGDR